MINQLLARTEHDLELARRRHEIAQAIAADPLYWVPLLGSATAPVEATPEAQSGCRQCGGEIPPRRSGSGGRPKVFCSKTCGSKWHATRHHQRKRAARRAADATELSPEPLPDQVDRPFHLGEFEDEWLQEQLRPPRLACEAPLR